MKICNNGKFDFELIHQAARDEWANTLWANLDVSVLSDGIDGFIKQLKRLPREVKALPLCHILEEKMKEFKNSIPLFSDLKNEALRERWVKSSFSEAWLHTLIFVSLNFGDVMSVTI